MKKYIVTTTINSPTVATIKFCQKQDWNFVIVGDTKTPHAEYHQLEKVYSNVKYLTPDEQDLLYPQLSKIIGWKTIQRRNIGFLYAYHNGADVLATIDDDNIPYDNWGINMFVNQEIVCDYYETENEVFDPLSVTNCNYLWHRGYPIELLQVKNNVVYKGKRHRKVLIQADLWDGDPDIDAMARLTYKSLVKFDTTHPYFSNKVSPFNSQNTFIAREVIPHYTVLPFIGRMDDIWSSYLVQTIFNEHLVYSPASVYQDRNKQDLITNLEKEVIGYRNTFNFIRSGCDLNQEYVPKDTSLFYSLYRSCVARDMDFL
jgi:hypothetical protein